MMQIKKEKCLFMKSILMKLFIFCIKKKINLINYRTFDLIDFISIIFLLRCVLEIFF